MKDQPQSEKIISLRVSLTEDEFVKLKLYATSKKLIIVYVCLFVISWLYFSMASHSIFSWPLSLFISLVITIPLLILIFFRTIRLFKKDYNKNYLNREEAFCEIEENGIRISQTNGFLLLLWKDINSVKEFSDFFIFWNNGLATSIPKRCFKSLEDMQFFKELVVKYVPDRTLKN